MLRSLVPAIENRRMEMYTWAELSAKHSKAVVIRSIYTAYSHPLWKLPPCTNYPFQAAHRWTPQASLLAGWVGLKEWSDMTIISTDSDQKWESSLL